jgi:hypothetical protein
MPSDSAARQPRQAPGADPKNEFEFVNLEGNLERFDISDPAHANYPWQRVNVSALRQAEANPKPERCIWHGGHDGSFEESLYRMLGGRWVLIFDPLSFDDEAAQSTLPQNRELTQKDACVWLRWVKNFEPPAELRDFNSHVVGSMPARLERNWEATPAIKGMHEPGCQSEKMTAGLSNRAKGGAKRRVRPPGDPAARAIGAAIVLLKEGSPISLRAACKKAGVDRKHLSDKYPDAVESIKKLGAPNGVPPKGAVDRRTGNLECWDDPDDDHEDD